MRSALRLEDSAVGELYSNTGIDEVVLSAAIEELYDGDVEADGAQAWVLMLERLMLARPGVATALLEG